MAFPKQGMYYSDVAKRIKRIKKNPSMPVNQKLNLIKSLANQCKIHEGEGSLQELSDEVSSEERSNRVFSCSGTKQTGFGKGVKLGEGKWKYEKGNWSKEE